MVRGRISAGLRRHSAKLTEEEKERFRAECARRRPGGSVALRMRTFRRVLTAAWDELSRELRRRRVMLEQMYRCNTCGLSEWLGEPLALELEHKDGNNSNWERSNVEALCPNCHSLTPSWRGRDGASRHKNVASQVILDAIDATGGSIHRGLKSLGLNPSGGNVARARKLLEIRELEKMQKGPVG